MFAAAVELFVERGFDATTMDDIADRADVARATVFNYMVELARLSTRTRSETVALMGAAVHSTNVLANPPLAAELASFVTRARDAGQVRADVGPDLSGLLVATGYFAILTEWISAEPPFDLESRLLQMVSVLCRGLGS